jgi:tagatose 6-phosphate kinase
MAYALERGFSPEESLRYATAAGSANALTPEAGNIRKEDFERLLPQIEIKPL